MDRNCLVSSLLLCTILHTAPAPHAAENLLANPGLEGAVTEEGLPESWYFFQDKESDYAWSVVQGGRRSSTKCIRISGEGEWGGIASARRPLDRSKRHMAAGWMRLRGPGRATVKFDYFDADGEYLGSTYSSHVGASDDWQIGIVVSGPDDYPEATSVSVAAVLNGSGAAWFDDFALIQRKPLASESRANLLLNGSIEAGAGAVPARFFTSVSEGANASMTWSRTSPHSGMRCLHIRSEADYAVFAHANVSYDRARTYVASAWARVGSGTAQMKIDYFKNDEWLGEGELTPFQGDGWQQRTVRVDPASYPEANRVGVAVVVHGAGEAWFDDLMLHRE